MKVYVSQAQKTDELKDTYDYVHAYDAARDVIENRSYHLIEVIGSEILKRIRLNPKVVAATVELTKLQFSQNGVSGIRVSSE